MQNGVVAQGEVQPKREEEESESCLVEVAIIDTDRMTNCWPFSRASDYADSERAPNGSSRCIGRRFGIIRESARYPKKSNFSSGSRHTRVFVSFTVNFSFAMMSRIRASASSA